MADICLPLNPIRYDAGTSITLRVARTHYASFPGPNG